MQRKKQKACLWASFSLLTVLSTYYIVTSPIAPVVKQDENASVSNDLEFTLKEVVPDTNTDELSAQLSTANNDYFVVHLLQRNTLRSKSLEECMETLSDPNAKSEQTAKAKEDMDALNELTAKEERLENLIRNQGYHDVIVESKDGHVNVIVQSKSLSSTQVDQILKLVQAELTVDSKNVSIRNRL